MTYETKFTKGQKVWMMRENKAVSLEVFRVKISDSRYGINITYEFEEKGLPYGKMFPDTFEMNESQLFSSKARAFGFPMRFEDIKIGGTYHINFIHDRFKSCNYVGNGVPILFNPSGYPENTLEVLLENGELGYFGPEDFKYIISEPGPKLDIPTKTLIIELARRKAAGEKIEIF